MDADVETGNLKLEKYKDVDALPNFQFPISNFTAKTQDQ